MKNGSGKFQKQPSQFNYQCNFSRQLLIKNVLLEGKQGLTGLTESNWEITEISKQCYGTLY